MNQKLRTKKTKALALLSGGLDSVLAVKLMLNHGIDVHALNFTSPFCLCNRKGHCEAVEWAQKFNIPIKIMAKGKDYLRMLRKPKHGYGGHMNPCIDCRIYAFKKAKKYAKQISAKFIFTGEVLNERPMSQHLSALKLIEKEAGLKNKILRPLSAKLLPETEAEKMGYVNRDKLLAIKGRSRKPQIELAESLNIIDYHCPSGGCLLTEPNFARRLKDFFKYSKNTTMNDIELLKIGRHFRLNKTKIVVGRNEFENKKLLVLKQKKDIVLEVKDYMGPVVLLKGTNNNAIETAASICVRYSDAKKRAIIFSSTNKARQFSASPIEEKILEKLRV